MGRNCGFYCMNTKGFIHIIKYNVGSQQLEMDLHYNEFVSVFHGMV